MELELGLKITRTRDDITSYSNLQISKDQAGPVFLSRETESSFILIVYLKGYRRESIDIKINEDGTRIAVSGWKPVQEMVLMGWMMHKKDVELRAFRKVFRIPDLVILDKIKAKFSREDSTLTVIMPKLVKGLRGIVIEEVEDDGAQGAIDRKIPEEPQGPNKDKEMEDIDHVVKKEIEMLESEVAQLEADQAPSITKDEGELEKEQIEAQPEIEREPTQVDEQVIEEGPFEEPKTAQEEEKAAEVIDEKGHLDSHRIGEEAGPESLPRGEDKISEPELEETQKEEEVRREEETPMNASHEEEKMMPGSCEPPPSGAKYKPPPEPPQTEEEHITAPVSGLSESKKPEPDDETEEFQEAQPPVQLEQLGEIDGIQDESEEESINGEIPEAREQESDLMEMREKNDPNRKDENATANRVRRRRKKLCPPIVFAGSAIIFSLIALVISLIRPKKT